MSDRFAHSPDGPGLLPIMLWTVPLGMVWWGLLFVGLGFVIGFDSSAYIGLVAGPIGSAVIGWRVTAWKWAEWRARNRTPASGGTP